MRKLLSLTLALNLITVMLGNYSIENTSPKIITPVVSEVNLKMVGDALIHGCLYEQSRMKDGSYNADQMFKNIKETISEADLAIINQETIFVDKESDYSSYPRFGSPTAVGNAAVSVGFDIVAHATNHTVDKGVSGVMQTLEFWDKYPDVTVLGIHENATESDVSYVTCNGIKLSFVNYTYGLNGLDYLRKGHEYIVDTLSDSDIKSTMEDATENSDFQIAILHVGNEYVYTPSTYAQEQVDRFIDMGADLVLCAHPHVVETYGYRTTKEGNTGLVYYSLGNFISGQDEIPRMIGGLADVTISKINLVGTSVTYVKDYTMIPIITHLDFGSITTYLLSDYTDDLCRQHYLLRNTGYKVNNLYELYNEMVSEADYLIRR